jgi:hypothetical protein
MPLRFRFYKNHPVKTRKQNFESASFMHRFLVFLNQKSKKSWVFSLSSTKRMQRGKLKKKRNHFLAGNFRIVTSRLRKTTVPPSDEEPDGPGASRADEGSRGSIP